MAIHVLCGKNTVQANLEGDIHLMPCKIHADCDAKVKKYFTKYIGVKDDYLTASFRGYPLKGKKVNLPEGYNGLVLYESMWPDVDKLGRRIHVIHTFQDFTYWNWDKVPSKNDAIIKALDWVDIAEALHAPILEE